VGGAEQMKGISIALIVIGAVGLLMSMMMFGDIGIAAGIGSITAILSGIGFNIADKRLQP